MPITDEQIRLAYRRLSAGPAQLLPVNPLPLPSLPPAYAFAAGQC